MSFSKTKCQQLSKYYQQLDHFFFVSNPTQDSFVQIYPFVKNKATVYYNPIDKNEIMQKANEKIGPLFSNYYTNLLTVGRISSEKGQDMIPYITKKLLDNDCNVRWYIIGDGDMRVKIEKIIEELNLKDRVFLLGTKKILIVI